MSEISPALPEGGGDFSPAPSVTRIDDLGFGMRDYCVTTGFDVEADGPGAAMLAAVQMSQIQNPEACCFHVEHLRTGRKWEVELRPNGEVGVQDCGEESALR